MDSNKNLLNMSSHESKKILAHHHQQQQQVVHIHYPFWYGGASSIVAAMVTHPLDLAKVRMQTAPDRSFGMISTMYNVCKNEGVLKLYSGLSASILRQATYSTTRFGIYEVLKDRLGDNEHQSSFMFLLGLSMISGALGGIVGNPADIINVRMQNDKSLSIQNQRNYNNAFDGLIKMIKFEGFHSLFLGIGPNLIRSVLMTSSQMVSYDEFKYYCINHFNMKDDSKLTHFTASILAGLVATTVCSPADVVKTLVMNAHKQHKSSIATVASKISHHGPLFLFRGWLPAFIRLGPQTIVTFLVLEQLKHLQIGAHVY